MEQPGSDLNPRWSPASGSRHRIDVKAPLLTHYVKGLLRCLSLWTSWSSLLSLSPVWSYASLLVQPLYSFLVFQPASLTFTQIITMSFYWRPNIPLEVPFESLEPFFKTMQVVPPFFDLNPGKGSVATKSLWRSGLRDLSCPLPPQNLPGHLHWEF